MELAAGEAGTVDPVAASQRRIGILNPQQRARTFGRSVRCALRSEAAIAAHCHARVAALRALAATLPAFTLDSLSARLHPAALRELDEADELVRLLGVGPRQERLGEIDLRIERATRLLAAVACERARPDRCVDTRF